MRAGPVAKLQAMWRALPAPAANQPELVRAKCVEMRDFVVRIRNHTAMQFAAPVVRGLSRHLAAADELEAARIRLAPQGFRSATLCGWRAIRRRRCPKFRISRPGAGSGVRAAALAAKARAGDLDLVIPPAERARYEASFARFSFGLPGRVLYSRARPLLSRTIRRTRVAC